MTPFAPRMVCIGENRSSSSDSVARQNTVAPILTRLEPLEPCPGCWAMVTRIIHILRLLIVLASRHRSLVLENLALRQQLAAYGRTRPKPAIRWSDRLFWIGLRAAWPGWKSALMIVRPATVIAWHRRGLAWYWRRRSRRSGGRPQVSADVRRLIREMAVTNPLWGAPGYTENCRSWDSTSLNVRFLA